MKIKVIEKSFNEVMAEHRRDKHPHQKPIRPNIFWRTLMRIVGAPDLIATHFTFDRVGMEKVKKGEHMFVLMNHSSFIDLEIIARVMYPRPFNIVATVDGFIGKDWLMRQIGCIPTKKFVADAALVRDMLSVAKSHRSSLIMYPEASYSFDGRATAMPDTLGKCVKLLGMPLVIVRTSGAYLRDPLYNNLQRRRVKVSAHMECLISSEEVKNADPDRINEMIRESFSFDAFAEQERQHIRIDEPFRADGIERILYKCPACGAEGKTEGRGAEIFCHSCGKEYTLNEYGVIEAQNGAEFPHLPDWYDWERAEVREQILRGEYSLDLAVDIMVIVDTKHLFRVGTGRLTHDPEHGFRLCSDDGQIDYTHKPTASYSLNADFNWYELGDVICIGDADCLFYCMPTEQKGVVAKARLATEEIYKICMEKKKNG